MVGESRIVCVEWGFYIVVSAPSSVKFVVSVFFFQAEDGIRDLVRSRGLGDVYKRQATHDSQARLATGGSNQQTVHALWCGGGNDTMPVLSLIHI